MRLWFEWILNLRLESAFSRRCNGRHSEATVRSLDSATMSLTLTVIAMVCQRAVQTQQRLDPFKRFTYVEREGKA